MILGHSEDVKAAALPVDELYELNDLQHEPADHAERLAELLAKHDFAAVADVPLTILTDIKVANDTLLEKQKLLMNSLTAAQTTASDGMECIKQGLLPVLEQCLHGSLMQSREASERYGTTAVKVGTTVQAISAELHGCDAESQAQAEIRRRQACAYEQNVRERESEQEQDDEIVRKALARTLAREQQLRAATDRDHDMERQHQVRIGVISANKAVWEGCKQDIEKYKSVYEQSRGRPSRPGQPAHSSSGRCRETRSLTRCD